MAKKNKSKKPSDAIEDAEVEETTEEVTEEEAEVEEESSLPDVDTSVRYAEVRGDNYHEYNAKVSKVRTRTIDLEVLNPAGRVEFTRTKVLPFDPAVKTGWWVPQTA